MELLKNMLAAPVSKTPIIKIIAILMNLLFPVLRSAIAAPELISIHIFKENFNPSKYCF